MAELEGKVAIVTGGGTGIGRATALLLARHGASVAVAGIPAEACEAVAAEIVRSGGRAIAIAADVSSEQDVVSMVRSTANAFGGLDIAFNNAGTTHDTLITETSLELWNSVVDVTLKGVFLCCKHEIPLMQRRSGGVIVNTGSTAGLVGFSRRGAYCAAKGGVIALSRALAIEWASENIRVNAICPGATDTPMVRDLYAQEPDPDAARRRHIERQPLRRLSDPADIAAAVLFLIRSSTATGSCLVVDSGYTAA